MTGTGPVCAVLSVAVLLSIAQAVYDVCPGELRKPGGIRWDACLSNEECSPDQVCRPSGKKYPGLWLCVRKPCRFHNDCGSGFYCHKTNYNPAMYYAYEGICCEGNKRLDK